eukprot:Gb_26747 [translate_table: standard]
MVEAKIPLQVYWKVLGLQAIFHGIRAGNCEDEGQRKTGRERRFHPENVESLIRIQKSSGGEPEFWKILGENWETDAVAVGVGEILLGTENLKNCKVTSEISWENSPVKAVSGPLEHRLVLEKLENTLKVKSRAELWRKTELWKKTTHQPSLWSRDCWKVGAIDHGCSRKPHQMEDREDMQVNHHCFEVGRKEDKAWRNQRPKDNLLSTWREHMKSNGNHRKLCEDRSSLLRTLYL